ncbi:DUF2690 domain-containing protein [Kitasatospora sp. NPDC096077]|uniref:DUF2690 domain-containing protein n=1 Tax=Kitasatospora sp. NPDC096077 TaxID=3155544 RepID=UPI0033233389
MRKTGKRSAVLAITLACGFVGLTVSPAVAAPAAPAAPARSGHGWDGVSPFGSVCGNDATTARQATIYHGNAITGYVQLRYSPTCRTVWGRVISYYNKGIGQKAGVTRRDGAGQTCSYAAYSDSLKGYSCFTNMLYDGGSVSGAYGEAPNWYNGGTDYAATTWY